MAEIRVAEEVALVQAMGRTAERVVEGSLEVVVAGKVAGAARVHQLGRVAASAEVSRRQGSR